MTANIKLAPYQLKAVEVLRSKERFVLGSEPGTGKTAVALTALSGERAIIVVPSFLLDNWGEEIEKWLPGESYQIVRSGKVKLKPGKTIYLMSYSIALSRRAELCATKIRHILLDESHYIKNPSTQRTKGFLNAKGGILRFFEQAWMLTGTPFPQHLIDCHTTFNFCLQGGLGKYWDFAAEYSYIKFVERGGHTIKIAIGRKTEKLDQLITIVRPILHRDRLVDVSDQLPDFRMNPVTLEHTKETKKFCDENKALLEEAEIAAANGNTPPEQSPISTFRKEWGILSIPAKLPFIENILEQGTCLVVFCWHREVANTLGAALSKRFKVVIATGDHSGPERHAKAKAFQDGQFDCMVATIGSMGTGINLTRASEAVFIEEGWSPLHREQGVGRLRRMTQKSFCMFHFPLLPDSIDKSVYYSVTRKSDLVDGFWKRFRGEAEEAIKAEEIVWD